MPRKAFDRVGHIKLFNTLPAHSVYPIIIRVLYNMYTNSDMQVRWKSECVAFNEWCKAWRLPVSYAIYVVPGWIIQKLKHSGTGCHIGRTYCGVFGYVDDLAIVSHIRFGLRHIIEIYEEYASEMDLLFNPKQSKLLCYNMLLDVKHVVYLCDAIVDVVDSEMYLGNKLYNHIYKTQIDQLVCDFERRSNRIIRNFSMCDSFTLKQGSETYGSQARCGSFDDCIWLADKIGVLAGALPIG